MARAGNPPRPRDRLVEILAVEHEVTRDLLLRLGERTVGEQVLVVADPDGRRRRWMVQRVTACEHSRASGLGRELAVAHGLLQVELLLVLPLRPDHRQILHPASLGWRSAKSAAAGRLVALSTAAWLRWESPTAWPTATRSRR